MSAADADMWNAVNNLRVTVAKLEERVEHGRQGDEKRAELLEGVREEIVDFKGKFANQAGATRVLVLLVSAGTAIMTGVITTLVRNLL